MFVGFPLVFPHALYTVVDPGEDLSLDRVALKVVSLLLFLTGISTVP